MHCAQTHILLFTGFVDGQVLIKRFVFATPMAGTAEKKQYRLRISACRWRS
jgi:hypothetical protein